MKAIGNDFSDAIDKTRPRNRFLRYGYKSGSYTIVALGKTINPGTATDDFGYTIDEICNSINTDEGKRYLFTFTSGNSCKAQNVYKNAYLGDNSQQRLEAKANESAASIITFATGKTDETIRILVNGTSLRSPSATSIIVSFSTQYSSYSPIDFEVYEIDDKATFNYYQGTSKTPYASLKVEPNGSIAELANVPAYLHATYHYGDPEEEVVGDNTPAEGGKTYTVRTSFRDNPPFVIDDKTYFSLGSDINTALKAKSVPTGDIDFAKYAVKMSGNWIDGYLLQDKNGNYLRNTGSGDSYVGSATSKFDIEKSGVNWYLKSQADGQYLVINTNGTVSFVSSEDKATALKNLSDEQAKNYINTYCPEGHYVGSYSKDQAGKISFAQILKGEGKIDISADKYYLFETAAADNYFMTSKESTQDMPDGNPTYKVNVKAEVTFSSLWQWKDNKIVNANTGKHLNWEAKLSDDETTKSYRLAVDDEEYKYKQAFIIQLGTNGEKTYYLKQLSLFNIGYFDYEHKNKDGYWFIREADAFSIKLNEVGGKSYATMYAPVKLLQDAEDKTKIYTGKMNGNGSLHLEEWEGGVIPAYTPLVLVNEEGAESAKFLISYEKAAREVTPDDNWTGTNIKLQFSVDGRDDYRLFGKNSNDDVGFFKPKATGNIPANRGYIYIKDLPQQTIGLQFPDGTTTSIDAAIFNGNNTAEDTPIYDLSGRRIMQPTRGQFYIRGGQKFIAQ